jgi:hypothetical protein
MKKLVFAGLAALTLSIVAMSPAEARDGCGPHRFRDWNGYCHWMRPPAPVYFTGGYGYGWHAHGPWVGHHWHRRWW